MEFSNYQNQAKRTAVYPKQTLIDNMVYLALGLTGESGEIANAVKKIIRDDNGVMSAERHLHLIDEMGDVLWYLAMLCYELEIPLETVALRNLAKLRKRQRDGILNDKNRAET